MPLSDEVLDREYDAAPVGKHMGEDEYTRTRALTPEEFAQLPAADRKRFFATAKWHSGEAQKTTAQGMRIGGVPAEQVEDGTEGFEEFMRRVRALPPAGPNR